MPKTQCPIHPNVLVSENQPCEFCTPPEIEKTAITVECPVCGIEFEVVPEVKQ